LEHFSWHHHIQKQAIFRGSWILWCVSWIIEHLCCILESFQICPTGVTVIGVINLVHETACRVCLRTDACNRAVIDSLISALGWYWRVESQTPERWLCIAYVGKIVIICSHLDIQVRDLVVDLRKGVYIERCLIATITEINDWKRNVALR
jgi:hypothetical protein